MEKLMYSRKEIRTFNGVSISIERFTEGELAKKEQRKIASEVLFLTANGFLRKNLNDPLFVADVNNHIIGAERLILARKIVDNSPVSFIVAKKTKAINLNFYELDGIIVDTMLQGSGLGQYLLLTDILESQQEAISLCTQSKRMRGMLSHFTSIDIDLSSKMANFKFLNSDHVIFGQIIKGLYVNSYLKGKSLYEDQIKFEKDAINDVSGMNWREGDALVLAGYLKDTWKLKKELENINFSFKPGFGN